MKKLNDEAFFNPDFIVPGNTLSAKEKEHLLNMEDRLKERIIGQDEAISAVCKAIRRNKAGFKDPNRPIGCFLFAGTTGTGKTEMCRALAEILFGDERKLLKLDMSEYSTRWDTSRLTGAAPGFLGYENGGILTNLVKENPKAVLCFDEIEKSADEVRSMLLQILEDGILTSSQGEVVHFNDMLIILTSNVGAREISSGEKMMGFSKTNNVEEYTRDKIEKALKLEFRPEFLNRIDEIIMFNKLIEKDVNQICKIMLKKIKSKAQRIGIKIDFDKTAITELVKLGYSENYGARELRRTISRQVEDLLADKIILGELSAGDNIHLLFDSKNGFAAVKKKAVKTAIAKEGQDYD
ncbi:MAG: AAA family ATPase [Oscillospiraceae bacterium]|nr:AAA family ATPase [Oscillospiraceae bacterium]